MDRLTLAFGIVLLCAAHAQAASEVSPIHVFPMHSAAAETSHVVSAIPAALHGASVTTGASGGYFLILDATADPGNGAVVPVKCAAVGANSTIGLSPDPNTDWAFPHGIVLLFSTTGCFTETQSATAFFSWQ